MEYRYQRWIGSGVDNLYLRLATYYDRDAASVYPRRALVIDSNVARIALSVISFPRRQYQVYIIIFSSIKMVDHAAHPAPRNSISEFARDASYVDFWIKLLWAWATIRTLFLTGFASTREAGINN